MDGTTFLKKYFTNFISTDSPTGIWYFLSPLLATVSFLYTGIVKIRVVLYQSGVLHTRRLQTRVISVGNITLGGTGKTPAVEMIARTLTEQNEKIAVLSRGYKGKSPDKINRVSDFHTVLMNPTQAGDEPYMLASKLAGVPVITGKNRYLSGTYAKDILGVDSVILDDGYQHIQLERNLNILLIDSQVLFGNGYLFPRGVLREPVAHIDRADAIILTKCSNSFDLDFFKKTYLKRDIPLFTSCYEPSECIEIYSHKKTSPNYLQGKKIFAFCAIGVPASFQETIKKLGADIVGFQTYPDHYCFTSEDLASINQKGTACGAEIFVTTEKDSVRLLAESPSLSRPVWMITVQMKIIDNSDRWNEMIKKQ